MNLFNSIDEAIEDLKTGKIIIVVDNDNRENKGNLVCLAEKVTPEIVNFMITEGRGLVCVPITADRAKSLELPLMVHNTFDAYGTSFTVSVDHESTSTGISAHDRYLTIRALCEPFSSDSEFKKPGHVFPLIAREGGVLEHPGHTEAAIDLARLCSAYSAGVICEIINEDGTMARVQDLHEFALKQGLKIVSIVDLICYRQQREVNVRSQFEEKIVTNYGKFVAFRYMGTFNQKQYIVLVKGGISDNKTVSLFIHSECVLGDVFGARDCNCKSQLEESFKQLQTENRGILIYQRKESTSPTDLRSCFDVVQIVKDLGVSRVKMFTKDLQKLKIFTESGIKIVKLVSTKVSACTDQIVDWR